MAGRPSDYDADEHPKAIRPLAAKWMPKCEIAEILGVATTTLDRWLKEHPEFAAAYALGRDDATDHVERSLYARANGYSHPSEKIVVVSGGKDEGASIERVPITEHYPPDAAALKFWLTNRKPKDWAEKSTVTHIEDRATRLQRARERSKKPPG